MERVSEKRFFRQRLITARKMAETGEIAADSDSTKTLSACRFVECRASRVSSRSTPIVGA